MLSEVKWGKTISGEVIDFTMMMCGGCGIPFYVPTRWYTSKVNNHGDFKCPNGCSRVFTGKSEAEKIKEEMEQLRQQKDKENQDLQNKWLDALSEKGKIEKQLKRLHNGVCPCCKRSFHNLQQHIKKQHPELIK